MIKLLKGMKTLHGRKVTLAENICFPVFNIMIFLALFSYPSAYNFIISTYTVAGRCLT